MLVLATLALLASFQNQTQDYGEQREITAPLPDPSGIRAADMDGDGDLDVVCASIGLKAVYWFENEGGGVMGQRHLVASEIGVLRGLEVGDVDDDGDVDIVVTARGREVWLLRNDGGQSFDVMPLLVGGVNVGPRIVILDMDGDGDTDILVASAVGASFGTPVLLFESIGGGVFTSGQAPLGPWAYAADLVLTDVDGDGILDLLAAGPSQSVSWYSRPNGPGFWTPHQIVFAPVSPAQIEFVDLDGDGDEDIITAGRDPHSVVLYENLGSGSFGPQQVISNMNGSAPEIALLDVDADGDQDIIVAGSSTYWIENLGALQFVFRGDIAQAIQGSGTRNLDVADLDGDGHLDLLLTYSSHGARWLRGAPLQASGVVFEAETRPISASVAAARAVALLDVDADGDLDVVGASRTGGLSLAINRGAARFDPPRAIAPSISGAEWLATGDLDADGDDDLAYRDFGGRIGWLENDGSGTLGAPTIIDLSASPAGFGPLLVDLDRDGDLDVIVGPDLWHIVSYDQVSPGVFAPARTIATTAAHVLEIVASDVDADGVLDLVYITGPGLVLQVEWVRGAGGGTFSGGGVIAAGTGALGLQVLDMNFDGNADVFWLEPGANELVAAWGSGTGTFDAPLVAASYAGRGEALLINQMVIGAWANILIAHQSASALTSEVERFQFSGVSVYPMNVITDSVNVVTQLLNADVDGDRSFDLVSSSHSDRKLAWYPSNLGGVLGVSYCGPASANSSGARASIQAVGRAYSLANTVSLQAFDLPPSATTLFLASRSNGLVVGPGGSQGTLCLGGAIGRFGGPGQVGAATPDGFRQISIDLTALPLPTGSTSVFAGELWLFQAWFRDQVGGVATSNFTDGTAVVFL